MFDYVSEHADSYHIQIVDANDLIEALDDSADCQHMGAFDDLLADKYDACSEIFMLDVDLMGIERPICVSIEEDGSWFMGDGHHRLATASRRGLELMVLFSTNGNYMMHGICSDPEMIKLADQVDITEFYGDSELEMVA